MKRIFITFGLILATAVVSFGQTAIVGGTTFDQKEGYDDWGWDFSTVEQLGPAGNTLAANLTYLEDGNSIQKGGHWVCVDNPFKLGTNENDETSIYVDEDDAMFVTNMTGTACTKLFSYTVNGLKPGSAYKVTMRVWVVSTATPSLGYFGGMTVGANLNQYMQAAEGGVAKSLEGNSFATGTYQDVTFSGTLTSSQTSMTISMMEGYNGSKNTVIGISDLKVYGYINPKILSGQGSEMCRGEQTLLTLDRNYGDDAVIKWEKSTNGSSWSTVSNKASMYDEVTAAKMYYRATVNGTATDPYEVTTVTCCETVVDGNTVYSSRETIFYEDFGYFTDTHEYVDANGNTTTTPSSYFPYRTDVSWTMPSTAGSFDAAGQINDGNYGVIVPTGIGYCTDANCNSTATWMIGNGAITSDHSSMINGISNSACLFMNVTSGFKGTIFTRTIKDLCKGKALTFECYVGNMSAGSNPVITLNIKNTAGNVLASKENYEVRVGSGWNRISIDNLILEDEDIVVEVQSWGENWSNGQDICFDDIKIMACSSPALDLFSNVDDLERATKVCSDPFTLGSVASNLLSSFYGSTLQYLFQYTKTPDVESSWVQIGNPSKNSTYTISNPKESSIFSGVKQGESVYFRVVAGTASTLASTANFSQTNYCKNYSISPSVEAIMDCPTCTEPKPLTITPSGKTALCPSDKVSLTVTAQDDASSFNYTWYKGDEVLATQTAATLPLNNIEEAGTYKVLVKDVKFPTLTACQKTAEIEITSLPYPSVTIGAGGEYCEGDNVKDISLTFTGTAPFTYTYAENSGTAKNGSSTTTSGKIVPTATVASGETSSEYVYTIKSLKDANCTAPAANYSGSSTVTIGKVPTVTITANPEKAKVCAPGTVALSASSTVSDASFAWSGKGSGSAASVTASASGDYTIKATNKVTSTLSCESTPATKTVTIESKPVVTISADKTTICSDETITVTASAKINGQAAAGGTYTWSGATGTGATATATKTATWPNSEESSVTVDYESEAGCKADRPTALSLTFNPYPNAPTESNQKSWCMNESAANKTLEAIADRNCTLTWYDANGSKLNAAPSFSIQTNGEFDYAVSQTYQGCESEQTPIHIIVNKKLSPEIIISSSELCEGSTTDVTVEKANQYEVTWSGTAATQGFGSTVNSATPTFTAPAANGDINTYKVHVYVKNAECDGESDATITVYPNPTVTLSEPDAICSGETATISATVTAKPSENGSFTWSSNVSNATETSASFGETTTGTVTYDFTSAKGCKAKRVSRDVTVKPIPSAPATTTFSKCLDAAPESLENSVTKASGAMLNWYGTNATGGTSTTVAPVPSTSMATEGTLYYVSQSVDNCESERAPITVIVLEELKPVIVLSDNGEVCEGSAVNVSLTDSYQTVEWSGTASAEFNSTNTATPVFKNTAAAKNYTVDVRVVDVNGCEGTGTAEIIVNPKPTAELHSDNPNNCISETTAQTISATITPDMDGTGSWTVATKTSEKTATFKPSDFAAGTQKVTYNFESEKGCKADETSINMVVYPLPSPTLTVSNSDVCESGNNSSVVTMSTTGTSNPDGFAYTIDNGGTIDDKTGAFDPAQNAANKEYTVTLTYTDENGCVKSTSDKIFVHSLPTVEINAPTEICYNRAAATITADVNPTGGSGVWTGTASSTDPSFDPATKLSGVNDIKYVYTDVFKCQNEKTVQTNVVKVDAPTVGPTQTVLITGGQASGSDVLTATASETGDVIQWMEDETGGNVIETATSYSMGADENTPVGSYKFAVREYRVVDGKNCYSDSTIATLVVSACEALAPVASDLYVCLGEGNANQELTAERNASSTISASHISWLDDDPVGKNGDEFDGHVLSGVGTNVTNYEVSNAISEIKDFVYYAAEYDEINSCWSAGTKVTVHVVDTPNVTISSPANICAIGDEAVPVTVNPHTGTLTANAGSVDGFNWLPGDYSSNDGDHLNVEFTYSVNSTPYADGTVCTSTVKSATAAHFMKYPDANPRTWLIGDIEHLPDLTGTLTSTGKTMTWYANSAMSSVLQPASTSVSYAADKDALISATAGLTSYTKSYWITQTDEFGCESEPSEVVLSLVDCPWSAPEVVGVEKCSGEELPDISATATGNVTTMATGNKATKWLWYSADNQSTPLETKTENSNSSSYAHGVTNFVTANTTTTFYVSYMAVESSSGQECESPKTPVTVTVNVLPEITVEDVQMCYSQGKTIVTATVNGTSSTMITNGGKWTLDGASTNINETSGEVDPTFAGKVDGTYKIQYTYTDAKNCTNSSNEANLVIEYPEVPKTTDYVGMTSNPIPVVLQAENIESETSVVGWYRTASSRNELSGNNNPWTVDEAIINPAEQTESEGMVFYVSQTVNGCVSERAEQKITIVDCPWTIETVENAETCQGIAFTEGMKATANVGANPEKWSWSTSTDLNEIAGESGVESAYSQAAVDAAGITTYYVRYYAYFETGKQSCWSAPRAVTSTVYSNPVVTFSTDDPQSVCHSAGDVRVRVNAVPGSAGDESENPLEETSWTTTGADDSFTTATESYAYFSASKQDRKTDTYTISYRAVDNKGCVGTAEREIKVIFLPKPTTEGFYAMTSQKNDVVVKVTSEIESGATIHWFDYEAGMSPDVRKNKTDNGDGATWNTGLAYDREIEKTYYARQYEGSAGCYSEATEALVRLVSCPIPNVTVDAPVACVYDVVDGAATMTAATNDWTERDGSKSEFRFYTSADATEYELGDGNGKFDPKSAVATANVYAYYVSEYNALPLNGLTNPEGCESHKVKTTVTVNETQAPTITPATDAVCEGETDKLSFKATFNGIGSGAIWFEEDPGEYGVPTVVGSPAQMTFSPTGYEPSDYTIYAVRFENDCYSEKASATYTIKPIPTAPEVEGSETCEGTDTVISARGVDDAIVSWYSDAAGKTFLGKGITYQPKIGDIGEHTYYAAQTVDGCQGPLAPVVYEIKMIPNAPAFRNPGNLCEYDSAPTLVAEPREGMTVKWYAPEFIADGEEYTLQDSDMTAGTKRYSVTQTLRGCESTKANVVFSVYPKPSSPRVTGASVCEGDSLIPTLSTDFSTDLWYIDSDAQVPVGKGYTYTPVPEEVGNKDVIYFVVREQRGCYSDTVPDTLHVIARPTFSIGNDTVLCIYDSVLTIQAKDYMPALTDLSFMEWTVSSETQSKKYADNAEHNVTPTNMITAVGDYTISARYIYRSDVATCRSDVQEMKYSVKARARKPLVFSTVICQGDDIDELRSLGSPNTVWNSLDGTLPDVWHGQSYRFQPGQRLDTGSYRFEIYDLNVYEIGEEGADPLGCESVRDTITLVVAPGAHTKLFGRDSVCMGAIGESYYTQFEPTSQYFWTVTGNHLNYSKDATSTSVRYIDWQQPGVDTLMVYEQTWAGCEGFDTLIVQIAPAPVAKFSWSMPGSSNIVELKDSTVQDSLWTTDEFGEPVALPIEYTMAWNFGHQGSAESEIDTLIPYSMRKFPIREGGYLYGYNCPILTVTNDFGCTSTYTECIFVNLSSSLYVPTAFSPSNPAHSVRTFQPKGFNLQTCEISVYDKWGNLLWFSNEVKDGMFVGYWDGRYDGKMMQSGSYIWKMEATFLDGQVWDGFDTGNGKHTKYGTVTLIR